MIFRVIVSGEQAVSAVLPWSSTFVIPDEAPFDANHYGLSIVAWITASKLAGSGNIPDMNLEINIEERDSKDVVKSSFHTALTMYHRYHPNMLTFIKSLFSTVREYSE